MPCERTDITITLEFKDSNFAEIVLKALEPENKQIDNKSTIQMKLNEKQLYVTFSSQSSISTVRNTIDDILNTISMSENIYKTVKRNE